MATVELQSEDGKGTLTYNEVKEDGLVVFTVDTEADALRSIVTRYFNKKRDYWIPESLKIDDYRVDKGIVPTKNFMYFELALMELQAITAVQAVAGITVTWPEDKAALDKIEA